MKFEVHHRSSKSEADKPLEEAKWNYEEERWELELVDVGLFVMATIVEREGCSFLWIPGGKDIPILEICDVEKERDDGGKP